MVKYMKDIVKDKTLLLIFIEIGDPGILAIKTTHRN